MVATLYVQIILSQVSHAKLRIWKETNVKSSGKLTE